MKIYFIIILTVLISLRAECMEKVEVCTPVQLRKAVKDIGPKGGEIVLKGDDWEFSEADTDSLSFYISNHDQSMTHKVCLPIVGATNLTIRGNGQVLRFDGLSIASVIMDSKNVRIENIRFDMTRPALSDAVIESFDTGTTVLYLDQNKFPCKFIPSDNGKSIMRLVFGSSLVDTGSAMLFDGKTHEIIERSADVWLPQNVVNLGNGRFKVGVDYSKIGKGAKVGDIVSIRPRGRFYPSMVIYRSKNTELKDFVIHSASGMGLIAQMSENITWRGSNTAEARTSGTFVPVGSLGRVTTLHADSSHFSNVKGSVIVENCYFETMMDDALNVHSTCLGITERISPCRFRCKYMHPQAVGFGVFNRGDVARFIKGKTLENGFEVPVKKVESISATEVIVEFAKDVPAIYGVGDAVENADYQPSVVFRGNVVANNRARGILITTPKKTIIENNKFLNVSGSAILFAGDAQGWYESGACRDVTVRNNYFRNCLTSRFQFCDAVISIYPMVRDLEAQKTHYHSGIVIENNFFDTFDVPLLSAVSADGTVWRKNKVQLNSLYKGWGKDRFVLKNCNDSAIDEEF